MHGGFSLDVCDMKDRSEAARMMVRSEEEGKSFGVLLGVGVEE
jgi:hypothetical protein